MFTMRVYVSYKQTWVKEESLKKELWIIKDVLNYLGMDSFIWYFDEQWFKYNAEQVLERTKNEIQSSDIVLCYINWPEKSEWMFLELGISYEMNKNVVIFINEKIHSNFWSVYWLSSDIIKFADYDDLEKKLLQYFGITLSRHQIDSIDDQLVYLLAKRFEIVKRVWKTKKKLWISPLQSERRKEVLENKIKLWRQFWISEEFIKAVWERIHQEALKIES